MNNQLIEKTPPKMMNWKVLLTILTLAATLMSSSYTMLIPFLPVYLTKELGVTEHVNLWSGAVFSVTFLVSTFMAPIWGAMSDKGSRKLMAIRSAVLLSLAYTLGGLVQTPTQLFFVRVLQGIAAGLWPALLAIMSSNCPQQKLGISMGIMQGAVTAGGVIGPLIGGVLAQYFGMRTSFFFGGAALFTITMVIILFVKDPPRKAAPKAVKTEEKKEKKPSLFKMPVIRGLLISACLTQVSITLAMPIFTFYVAFLQGSEDNIVALSGYVFALLGIAGVIASPLWGWVGQTFSFKPVLLASMLFAGLFAVISAIPSTLDPFIVLRFIGGLAFASVFPSINALLTRYTPSTERGRAFGISFSFQQAGSIIGPLAGGAIASLLSLRATMIAAGVVQIIAFAYLWTKRKEFIENTATPAQGIPKSSVTRSQERKTEEVKQS